MSLFKSVFSQSFQSLVDFFVTHQEDFYKALASMACGWVAIKDWEKDGSDSF